MKAKNEINRWLKDEKFIAFANKRAKEEFFNSENNYIDPQYEEMAEGFEDNDEYVVPMVDYMSYRLHRAKIYRNRRRRERDIWWVWIQLNPNRSLEKFTFFLIYNGKIFFVIIKV